MPPKELNRLIKESIATGGIIVLSLAICHAYLHPRLIEGHDGSGAFVKTMAMVDMLSRGQWDLTWQPYLYSGYGYPLFTFYPPLFYFLAGILSYAAHDLVLGLNGAVILVYMLSGLSMYYFARRFWGTVGGLFSAAAFLLAPFHIATLYVRSGYAEMTGLMLLPVILLSIYELSSGFSKKYFIIAVLSIAGLMLSHHLMSLIFLPLIVLWGLILFAFSSLRGGGPRIIFALIMGVALAAVYWVPVLFLKTYVNTSVLIRGFDFNQHFIEWRQLLKSSWGYGGSVAGSGDGMSFQLGWGHGMAAVASGIFLISQRGKKILVDKLFLSCLAVVGVGAVLMTMSISGWVWQRLPLLSYVQFPWRFLTLAILVMSFFSGAVSCFRPRWLWTAAGLMILFLSNIAYCQPGKTTKLDLGMGQGLTEHIRSLDMDEYLPVWARDLPVIPSQQALLLSNNQSMREIHGSSSLKHIYFVNNNKPVLAVYNGFYFPGWKIFIDGREARIFPHPVWGTMIFSIPEGKHEIRIVYTVIPVRIVSAMVSLAALIALLYCGLRARSERPRLA